MARVAVTGGTGFLGRALVAALAGEGHRVVVLTRRAGQVELPAGALARPWPGSDDPELPGWWEALEGAEAVVHLAGAPLASGRWDGSAKARIRDSRVLSTRRLVEGLGRLSERPQVLVSASAVGYYGDRGDEPLTEEASPGRGFLAEVCQAWEAAAQEAEALGIRVVRLRIGLVLGPGGALTALLRPFRLGLGGPLGRGDQWVPWVHRDDVVGLVRLAWSDRRAAGALNAVAPEPVRQADLARALGRVLRRPAVLRLPAPLLRLALGEVADALLLASQRALPAQALRLGYAFRHRALEPALRAALRGEEEPRHGPTNPTRSHSVPRE